LRQIITFTPNSVTYMDRRGDTGKSGPGPKAKAHAARDVKKNWTWWSIYEVISKYRGS
jgi:hypothetical protein